MKNILVVGGFPNPIGGVTNFIYRLAVNNMIGTVVDLYPSRNKNIPSNFHGDIIECNGFFCLFLKWVFRPSFLNGIDIIHFNFSRCYYLPFVFLMPKKNKKFYLMLHHGKLAVNSFLFKIMLKRVLLKFDKIYYLSQSQFDFYKKTIDSDKVLINSTSYIPLNKKNCISENNKQVVMEQKNIHISKEFAIISGHCTRIYNHHWVIELFNKCEFDKHLLVFLYGEFDPVYYSELVELAGCNDRISFFKNTNADLFNIYLSKASLYFRPNSIDSFGLVVADAISMGVDVIASDVCERYPGAYIFTPTSYFSLSEIYQKYNSERRCELIKSKGSVSPLEFNY
ncbi:glycosyltransferase [Aeromonas caviae]|uniref:glycosyltransferase n=1 Tax=Aeromonas caviae TaxID=648 RepID=UPI003305F2E0